MAADRKAVMALALLAIAATVLMPTCVRAATTAGPLSPYGLAAVRGIAGHWVATISGTCVEMILTPQGRLTQRTHNGSTCDTPVTLDINSTVVAASCADIDSVPIPRLYKVIFAYDIDPNVLGCFLVFRRAGGVLTQAVTPNGRRTAFACPGFAPHPTAPPPAVGLFYIGPDLNTFTGLNGTLAAPGDDATVCGNMVTDTPFTGPYLPFADDFSGPKRNVPKTDLWAIDTGTTSGAVRGGPRPQTRQGTKLRDNSAEAKEQGFLVQTKLYLQTRPLVVGPGAAIKINKMIMPYNPAAYQKFNSTLAARMPAVPDTTSFNLPRFTIWVTSLNGADGWRRIAYWTLNEDWSNQTSFTFPMRTDQVQGVSILTVRLEFVGVPPNESDDLDQMWFKGVEITNVMWVGVDDNLNALWATIGKPGTVVPTVPVAPEPFFRDNTSILYNLGTEGFEAGTLDSTIWSGASAVGNLAVVSQAVGGIKPYRGKYMVALGKEGSTNYTLLGASATLLLTHYSAMTMYMAVTSTTGVNCTPIQMLGSGALNVVNIRYRTSVNPNWRNKALTLDPTYRPGGWAKVYLNGGDLELPESSASSQLQFAITWSPSAECPSVLLIDEIRFYNLAISLNPNVPPSPYPSPAPLPPSPPPYPSPKSRRTRSPPPPPVRRPRKDRRPNKHPNIIIIKHPKGNL